MEEDSEKVLEEDSEKVLEEDYEEQNYTQDQQADTDDFNNENNVIDASSQFLEKQQNNLHEAEQQIDDELEVNN